MRLVECDLFFGIHAGERIENLAIDRRHRLGDAFAEMALRVAIAQLDRLMRAGRSARRNRGAPEGAVLERHIDLDGGIAAAVENFAAGDVKNGGHEKSP